LVGLGEFPGETLIRLESFFEDRYGINVGILESITVPDGAYDNSGQIVAPRISASMQAARVGHVDRPIIGLTDEGLVIDAGVVFSARSNSRAMAVVSVARMDPVNLGLPPDDDLLFLRMSKMVGKNIGALCLGLPLSNDPQSVMYEPITSLTAIDGIADDFALAGAR
jgi:predicted Zn-dependent protease